MLNLNLPSPLKLTESKLITIESFSDCRYKVPFFSPSTFPEIIMLLSFELQDIMSVVIISISFFSILNVYPVSKFKIY